MRNTWGTGIRIGCAFFLLFAVGCAGGPRLGATPRFAEETERAGLAYRGSGKCVAFGDANDDGRPDLYACVVYGPDHFYTNNGDGTFSDAAAALDIRPKADGHGVVFADVDNDGHTDLFVACNPEGGSDPTQQANRLYLGPDMKDVARAAGVEGKAMVAPGAKPGTPKTNRSCGVALGDYDNDGDLDIYLARGAYEFGHPNALYRNTGRPGKPVFVDVAKAAGVDDLGAGKMGGYVCAFADFDDDGFPDLFIGNLDLSNQGVGLRLFRNRGDGTFEDVSKASGVTGHGFCTSCAVGDVDNDGDLDLLVSFGDDKQGCRLFVNQGGLRFEDRAKQAGLGEVLRAVRGCCMADVNHDGWLDLFVADFPGGTFFVNQGDGTFRRCAQEETGVKNPCIHGCAFADTDGDGDLDLYSTNWHIRQMPETGRFLFHRNLQDDRNWLKVRVKGAASNRSAVGARVSVYDPGHAGDKAHLRGMREIMAGRGVFSSPPLEQHFGLGRLRKVDVVVRFPTTEREVVRGNVPAGTVLEVTEPGK